MKLNKIALILIVIVLIAGIFLWLFLSTQVTKQSIKSISAGGAEGYDKYTIEVPSGWLITHDTDGIDKLKMQKNVHTLHISQEPGDGFECLYEKDTAKVEDDFFSDNFSSFTELTTKDGKSLRRGLDSDGNSFVVCEKNENDKWFSPTSVGYIGYSIPANPDDATLKEMDTIVSSLDKEESNVLLTDQFVAGTNNELPSLNTSHAKFFINDISVETDTTYDTAGMIIKLSAIFLKDDVTIRREFYFDKGKSRFVHEVVESYDEENWFYFENDKMVAWLTGPNKQEKAKDEAYSTQEQDLLRSELELLAGVAGD